MPSTASTASDDKTSALIRALAIANEGKDVAIAQILHALKDRGFPAIMIVFALPNFIIPGLSLILGAPVLICAVQMVLGREEVWLPQSLSAKTLSAARFQKMARVIERTLLFFEKRSKARWTFLMRGPFEQLFGGFVAIFAGFLMLPVPFGNALPALGISLMAFGYIEKDGLALFLGMLLSLLGACYIAGVLFIGLKSLDVVLGFF